MDHWSISTPELERYLRRARQERSTWAFDLVIRPVAEKW